MNTPKTVYAISGKWCNSVVDGQEFTSLEAAKKELIHNQYDYMDDDNDEVIIYEIRPVKRVKIVTGFEEMDLSGKVTKAKKK